VSIKEKERKEGGKEGIIFVRSVGRRNWRIRIDYFLGKKKNILYHYIFL